MAALLVLVGFVTIAPTASAEGCDGEDDTEVGPDRILVEAGDEDTAQACVWVEISEPRNIPDVDFDCGNLPCTPEPDDPPAPPGPQGPPTPKSPPGPGQPPCNDPPIVEEPCLPAVFPTVSWAAAYAPQVTRWAEDVVLQYPGQAANWAIGEAFDVVGYGDDVTGYGTGTAGQAVAFISQAPWGLHADSNRVTAATIEDFEVNEGATDRAERRADEVCRTLLGDPDARFEDCQDLALDEVCQQVFGEDKDWSHCEDMIPVPGPRCDEPGQFVKENVDCLATVDSVTLGTPTDEYTPGVIVETRQGAVFVPGSEIPA